MSSSKGRYATNPTKFRAMQKEYYQKNKDKMREYQRQRYHNRDKQIRIIRRMKLFEILGGPKCVRCGFADIRALQFDHVNGDGHIEIRKIKRKVRDPDIAFYKKYVDDPQLAMKTLQVLCANCNWIKRADNQEYYKKKRN